MAGAEKVGAHKTSMLQDLEAGRPMEIEAVVGAVVELGDRLGVPMPATRAVYACAKMLDERARRAPNEQHEQPANGSRGAVGSRRGSVKHQQPLVPARARRSSR